MNRRTGQGLLFMFEGEWRRVLDRYTINDNQAGKVDDDERPEYLAIDNGVQSEGDTLLLFMVETDSARHSCMELAWRLDRYRGVHQHLSP